MAQQLHNDASDASRTLSRLTHDTGNTDNRNMGDALSDDHESRESSEPTVLDYARFHKLCQHYLYDNPLELYTLPTLTEDIEASLRDPAGTEPVAAPPETFLQEPLLLDRGAAELLKAVKALEENVVDSDALGDIDYRGVAKLTQEVPIVRSDHEQDLREFGNIATTPFTGLSFPSEEINDEENEGLGWPSSYFALPAHFDRLVQDEKLEVPKKVLLRLQDALQSQMTVDERSAILDAHTNYEKKAVEKMTPPLFPLTPPLTPFQAIPDAASLPLLSGSSDTLIDEIGQLDEKLFRGDDIAPRNVHGTTSSEAAKEMSGGSSDLGLIYSPLAFLDKELLSPLPVKRRAADDLKVEGPLTPPLALQSSVSKKSKNVTFPETLHTFIPDPELPSACVLDVEVMEPDTEFDTFFREHVAPLAEKSEREVENEQLLEVDTTLRVDVPRLFAPTPTPPWKANASHANGEKNLEAQRVLLKDISSGGFKQQLKWPGLGKLERRLHWSPFPPQLAKVGIDESLDGQEILAEFIEEMSFSDIMRSEQLTWRSSKLKILEDDRAAEEQLEYGTFAPTDEIVSLIRGREVALQPTHPVSQAHPNESHQRPVSATIPLRPRSRPEISTASGAPAFGGFFSAVSSLSNFIGIQSGTLPKPHDIPVIGKVDLPALEQQAVTQQTQQSFVRDSVAPTLPRREASLAVQASLLPTIPTSLPARSFIISSALLKQRGQLVREIEKLYINADFIERDFDAPGLTVSGLQEADIGLSPATGVLVTDLQRIKQRALPGQGDRSVLRERIAAVSQRYERLLIRVSAGKGSAQSRGSSHDEDLDERDCIALSELSGFCGTLQCEVAVGIVSGGDIELAHWMVAAMARYGVQDVRVKVLQDETLWELFLRRCGLNPFAAQAVLSVLKTNSTVQPIARYTLSYPPNAMEAQKTLGGIAGFVQMPADERLRCFESLLGGQRVLGRVNKVIEVRWLSAADGFASR